MPSAASADLAKGYTKLHDVDFTFTNSRFEEREKTTGGLSPVAMFVSDLELNDGSTEETAWEIAPVEWLSDRDSGNPKAQITEDGKFIDVDEQNPYEIAGWSEAGALFLSLERRGISASVMARVCAEPELLDGVKAHGIQEPNGKPFTAKQGARKGQTIQPTTLVVETIIEDPNADKKAAARKPAGRPAAAASKAAPAAAKPGRKPAPAPVEEEPESDVSETDQAGIDTVNVVLTDPKVHVKTYSARQNGGGVTIQQMATASMTAYKGKTPPKSEVVALLRDPDWAEAMAEAGGWTFDRAKGIYFPPE